MNTLNWGLQQGLLGARQQTLKPTLTSVGPNRYLTRDDMIMMVALALLVHATIAFIASLFPDDPVTDIPVRPLSFKIGDADRVTVSAPRMITTAAPPPVPVPQAAPAPKVSAPPPVAKARPAAVKPAAPTPWRTNKETPSPQPHATASPAAAPAHPLKPLPSTPPAPAATAPEAQNPPAAKPASPALSSLPDPALLNQPAVATTPQRFVRENVSGQNPQATQEATVTEAAQAARARYEQIISEWIQRHKLYPTEAGGAQGRAVVRFQIDRSGNLRDYGIRESAGNAALDAAAVDMVRRANPMPAVPVDYPAGSLIEFNLPINFAPPQ